MSNNTGTYYYKVFTKIISISFFLEVSISKSEIEKRSRWVIEKTVSKAKRAWFLDGRRGE